MALEVPMSRSGKCPYKLKRQDQFWSIFKLYRFSAKMKSHHLEPVHIRVYKTIDFSAQDAIRTEIL